MAIEEVPRKVQPLTEDQLWGADSKVPHYIPEDLRVMYWFTLGGDNSGPFTLTAEEVRKLIERVGRAEAGRKGHDGRQEDSSPR